MPYTPHPVIPRAFASDFLRLGRDDSEAHGVFDEAHQLVNLEALHDLAAMGLDRLHAQGELFGDTGGGVSLCDESQHLELAGSELEKVLSRFKSGFDGR